MILDKLKGKTREEQLEILRGIVESETDEFMEHFTPFIRKDFEKGVYANLDGIVQLCAEAFRCGLSQGIVLGLPD